MRQSIIWMIMMLQYSIGARYPECIRVPCPNGTVPLSPLSYNTVRSNVFNGTQPSNEGCTNGAILGGRETIDCGQGTTLIDCDHGIANVAGLSNSSNTFAWNRTSSVAEQVSIVFRFDQLINISKIGLLFFNSPSNSIIIPNVRLYRSNDDSITPSNEINIIPIVPRRDRSGLHRFDINIDDNGLRFQYLRIEMSFYMDSEWIFLSEVQFCGDTAPYHITQPSTDNSEKIVTTFATMATLTCSLNVTIPSTVTVTWLHNDSVVMTTPPNGNTTALMIQNLQPSDAGVYQCVFNDTTGYVLRRSTNLLIVDVQIIQPSVNFVNIPFNELTSSVQLTCSLNIEIPSGVTVTWFFRGFPIIVEPPNEVITVDNSTTLVIHNPQPSDVGDYQCLFMGLDLQRRPVIALVFQNTTFITITTATTTITATSTIASSSHRFISHIDITIATYYHSVTTSTNSNVNLPTVSVVGRHTTYNYLPSTEPTVSASSNDNNNSSVGVIVATVVTLVLAVFIVIAVVVVGIIVVWKGKKREGHTKPEGIYYSTINETSLARSPTSKPEPVYSEMDDGQDDKEPQYMDITDKAHSTKQADKVAMQDNPAYSAASEHLVELQDNPAYCTSFKHHA